MRVLLALLLAVPGAGTHTDQVVELHVQERYAFEPATLHLTVEVEPDAANRTLRIELESSQFFTASDMTLDGADEKRLHVIEFKNLSAGRYELRAFVLSKEETRGYVVHTFVINGGSHQAEGNSEL